MTENIIYFSLYRIRYEKAKVNDNWVGIQHAAIFA